MDRAAFFAAVRSSLFGGKLSAEQVKGMEAVIDAFERQGLTDKRWRDLLKNADAQLPNPPVWTGTFSAH